MNTISVPQHTPDGVMLPAYDTCKAHIAACLLGDTRAWQDFVGTYKPHITKTVAWTLRRNGTQTTLAFDTDDVVQEVFVRLIRGNYRLLETWNPERGTFTTWLTVVSRSAALDFMRNKRNLEYSNALHLSLDECPELIAEAAVSYDTLFLPKGVLSPRQQSILYLIFEKDMNAEEIAALLDIHPQTVRSIRHSALLKLKDHYTNESQLSIA